MAVIEIRIRASRRSTRKLLRKLPAILAGRSSLAADARKALLVRMGLALLHCIRDAFLIKSRGGTDESGLRWQPLSPFTIAYKRRHKYITAAGKTSKKYLPKSSKRASAAPSYMLTKKQRERWWSLYGKLLRRYSGDKHHAAAAAWTVLKSEGARTIFGVYSTATVEILRDTDALYTSLSPAAPPGPGMSSPPKNPLQVFRLGRADVTVGTARRWAGTHHRGVPGRIPQRRLWPDPRNWPHSWQADMAEQAKQGVVDVILALLGRP